MLAETSSRRLLNDEGSVCKRRYVSPRAAISAFQPCSICTSVPEMSNCIVSEIPHSAFPPGLTPSAPSSRRQSRLLLLLGSWLVFATPTSLACTTQSHHLAHSGARMRSEHLLQLPHRHKSTAEYHSIVSYKAERACVLSISLGSPTATSSQPIATPSAQAWIW